MKLILSVVFFLALCPQGRRMGIGMESDTSSVSKYTLIFNTCFIEQGFSFAGILVHKNPEIRGELVLVEANDKSKIIAKEKITKAMGKAGPHFETGEHVENVYAEAGEGAAAFIINS